MNFSRLRAFAAGHESGNGPSRQAAFFGPTVANGALRTWLDLQLRPVASDPELTLRAANYCIAKGSCAFVLAALRKLS